MENMILFVMELIGTVAFAVSGALIAVGCELDLFGVVFIGCITAVGGGIVRDILLGQFPASVFSGPLILLIAAVTSLLVFIVSYCNASRFESLKKRLEIINNFFDAIGLAAFTVAGVESAFIAGFGSRAIFAVSMGMITGIGGGMMRDILVDKTPYVLKKRIYALASILGGALYYGIRVRFDHSLAATFAAVSAIILIRLTATVFRWRLPRIRFNDPVD